MFGREIRTKVPEISKSEKSETLDSALARDKRNKEKMQQYSDNKNRSTPSAVSEGDMVLLKQPKSNKLSTSFDPNGYRVVKRHGSNVLLQRGNEPAIMRNVSLTRKIEDAGVEQFTESNDEEDEIEGQPVTAEPAVTVNTRPARMRRLESQLECRTL
jgi:hypothetical protein